MKKLMFVAALGVAGMVSGKDKLNHVKYITSSGLCVITIYRIDEYGVKHFVREIGVTVNSESECRSKAISVQNQLSFGIEPGDVAV